MQQSVTPGVTRSLRSSALEVARREYATGAVAGVVTREALPDGHGQAAKPAQLRRPSPGRRAGMGMPGKAPCCAA